VTAKERAKAIVGDVRLLAREDWLSDEPILNRIAAVIREAVAAERDSHGHRPQGDEEAVNMTIETDLPDPAGKLHPFRAVIDVRTQTVSMTIDGGPIMSVPFPRREEKDYREDPAHPRGTE